MERYCEAAVQALSGAGPLPRASSSHGRETRRRRDFFASPCSSSHLSTERLLCFGVAVVGNTEENSNSLLFGFNRKEGVQVTGKVDERCPHAERSAPFRRWEGGRTRGTAGRESLAPAPRLRTCSAAASQGGATGLGTGQRIPGRRACCPVVTPGPRSAGVNDRRRRQSEDGRCSLCRRPQPPLSRHHIALSLSNTARAPRLAGPRPRPRAPPPYWVPSRDCAFGPASFPFVRRGCARALRQATALGPALAEPPRQSPSHGAGTTRPYPPQCTYPRGGGRGTRKGPRPRGVGAASSPARPAQSQALPAFHGLQYGAERGARAWPGAAGTGARLCPPRPRQGPLLPWSGAGG